MKKIIILLVVLGSFVTAKAQSSKDEARRVVLGQPKKKVSSSQQGRTVILGRNTGQNRTIYRTNRTYYGKKNNPGKHLGWYKGVGNPHRYGTKPGKGKKG